MNTSIGFLPLTSLAPSLPSNGGICKLFVVPIQWINNFPSFDNFQYLTSLPTLIPTKNWLLLSEINRNKAIEEDVEILTAGRIYKYKITCRIKGNHYYNQLMLENFNYHEWLLLIEERIPSSEQFFYRLIGNKNTGAIINHNYKSGGSGQESKGIDLQFLYESPCKNLIVITGDVVTPSNLPQTSTVSTNSFLLFQSSINFSAVIPADKYITDFLVKGTSMLKIGLTPGGNEIYDGNLTDTEWNPLVIPLSFSSITTLYFSGLTGASTIKIYIK